jgi:DNA-binding NarL/FixJ family response regulator
MDKATFIQALDLEVTDNLDGMAHAFDLLHDLPYSFLALNWHSSHEYLYISENVQQLTGHSFSSFRNHGIIFLFSITPIHKIKQISTTLYQQLEEIDQDPTLITRPVNLAVDGGIVCSDGIERPFCCLSTILDYIPGQRKSYLILSTYISEESAGNQLDHIRSQALDLQARIQKLYVQLNPHRFGVFESYKLLTPRELEIAEMIRNGDNSRTIADKLSIALNTVTSHRKSLLKKMNAGNTAEMMHLLNMVK